METRKPVLPAARLPALLLTLTLMPGHKVATADTARAGGKSQPMVWVGGMATEEMCRRQRSDPWRHNLDNPAPHNEGLGWLRRTTLTIRE